MADTSVGPSGITSPNPVFTLATGPLWTETRTNGETWLSCATCGRPNVASISGLAKCGR